MEFSFKPIIVLTAAVAMVAGCQRENLPDSPSVPQEGCQSEQEVRTFTVFSESRQPQDSTRTYLGGILSDASRQVLWNKGDNLYVTDGSSGGKFTVTSESGSTKAVIEGSIAYSEWYSSVYPYSIVSSYGKDGFSVNLPSVQTYYPDGVSPDSYPMVALCDNDMFRFKNVCGIFVLQLKGDGGKVSGISFSGRTSDGKEIPVAGAATLAFQSGSDPTLSFAGGASTSVTLDCSNVSSLPSLSSTPTAFHIVLPYGTYDSITLSITLTDGRTMTVNSSRPLTIHRSGFTLAGSINVQVVAETGVKSFQLKDFGTIPYICDAQTRSIKCLDMSYDIIEKELGIDYAEFLNTYTWEGSKTYYLKSGKTGTAKDDFAVSELYGTIEFIKDSSIGALNDRFELTVFKAQADKIGIGSNKVLYAHFTNENGKKDVYIGFKITIADAAKVVFGDKNPSYWFNDIAGENQNTVRINVRVPNYWMTGDPMNDYVTIYSKDLRDNYVGNIVTVKLDQTAANYDVYKNLGNLGFKYNFQFNSKQPKINGNTLTVKNNGTEIWVENTRIITLDPTTSVVRYQCNDVSKKYLNLWSHKETDEAKMLYCNIDLVATYGECMIPCGTTTFHARFLRPITIMSNSEALLKCSTAIGGSIEIGNLFNAIDWQFQNIFQATSNGYEPCYYPDVANPLVNWYGYYGLKTLKVDIDNIKTDQTGIIQNIKEANSGAELWLSPKNDVMTSITPTNVDISNISNLKDYVLCYSDRAGVTKDFNLYIPIEIEYAWGTLVENVIVPVEPLVEYVDLGLSVKWASCNVGASKPEEYGGYYQWAGTKDVSSTSINLDWENCPYHTGSDYDTGWTKYIPSNESSYWSGSGSPDNKTVLDSEDDVAHVTLGGKWRMPTDIEWNELIKNCNSEWTTLNGVNGWKFTSNKNGNSIFLPAAGTRYYHYFANAGSYGYYWSSSRSKKTLGPEEATMLYFVKPDYMVTVRSQRHDGLSVRPVFGDRVNVTGISLSKTSLSLEIGKIATLGLTVTPSNAAEQSVSWSSSNASVATVDADGRVTALQAGSTTVTVTTIDGGHTAKCSVTVISLPDSGSAEDIGRIDYNW